MAGRSPGNNRFVEYLLKDKAAGGSGRAGQAPVMAVQQGEKRIGTHSGTPDQEQGADKVAYHMAKKTVTGESKKPDVGLCGPGHEFGTVDGPDRFSAFRTSRKHSTIPSVAVERTTSFS